MRPGIGPNPKHFHRLYHPRNGAIRWRASRLDADAKPGIDHLGFQTDNAEGLAEPKGRAEAADIASIIKDETSCCARSETGASLPAAPIPHQRAASSPLNQRVMARVFIRHTVLASLELFLVRLEYSVGRIFVQ